MSRPAALRAHLFLLVLVTLVPMVAFSTVAVALFARDQRAAAERGAVEIVRALIGAVDRELDGSITTLVALATSRNLDGGDLRAFYEEAGRVLESNPDWLNIHLALPTGQQLVDLRRPLDAPLPAITEPGTFEETARSRRPVVGSLVKEPITGQLNFTVRVPVVRHKTLKYVLAAVVKPAAMAELLARQRVPGDWVLAVLDRNRVHVARTRAPERFVAEPGSPDLFAALARPRNEGWYRGRTPEQLEVYAAYSRSAWSGWTVVVAMPTATVDAPLRRSIGTMIGGAAFCLLLGVLLAVVVGGRIARPIASLSRLARALERGEAAPAVSRSSVREIDDLGDALGHAAVARIRAEASLRVTLASIGDAVIATDTELRVVFMNPVAESLTGWPFREARDQPLAIVCKILNEDTRVEAESPAERVLREGAVVGLANHTVLVGRDGIERPIDDSGAPIRDERGQVVGVVLVFHDITERRQAERRTAFLAEASAILASSLDYLTTLETVARLAVPHLADLCAVDIADDAGIRRVALVHVNPDKEHLAREARDRHDLDPEAPRGVAGVLRTGRAVLVREASDLDVRPGPRDPLWLSQDLGLRSWMIVPLVARGRVLGAMTFVISESDRRYDPTDLAHAEDLARRAAVAVDNARLFGESENRRQAAEAFAEVSRAINETLDPGFVAQRVADSLRELLATRLAVVYRALRGSGDLEAMAVAGEPGPGFVGRFVIPRGVGIVGLAVRQRKAIVSANILTDERIALPTEVRAQLEHAPHRASIAVPLIVKDSVIGGLLVGDAEGRVFEAAEVDLAQAFADQAAIALENARLYEEAGRDRREAEEANRAKDEFLATLSHELRTPLTALLGWTRMLRTGVLDEPTTARALETVERNVRLLVQLIEDLLDVSRIITGKLRLDIQSVDLGAVVEAAMDTVRPTAEAKGIRLVGTIDPDATAVLGDADRLQQVVWNLLSNAIKFTPGGGGIEVRLDRIGTRTQLSVSDTGQGIAPDFLPHVFERFRQAEATSTRAHGGLGLGLALVRHLVELHGGTVTAESAGVGRGATFKVSLPPAAVRLLAPEVAGPVSERPRLDAPPSLEGLRVLVIDDEADARDLVKTVLESCGATVIGAPTASDGLEALERLRPDVLVSDLGLPGDDGYTLIARVRALPPERGGRTPAAALTAYARREDRARALVAGFDAHIAKPVEPGALVSVVARLAERSGSSPG